MGEPLRFHPRVADDLEGAANWYDAISIQLGNRFRSAVDQRFDEIEISPESFGFVEPPMRAALVSKFPYLIVFDTSHKTTEVMGVFHTASNPAKWRKRKS